MGPDQDMVDSGPQGLKSGLPVTSHSVEEAVGVMGLGDNFVCVILTSSSVDAL